MDNVEMSENKEAVYILISTIGSGITGFLAGIPIPEEWKIPLVTLSGVVTSALLVFWKSKINKS